VFLTFSNKTGQASIPSACHVLILTYYSGGNVLNSRGFVMMYTAVMGASGISPASRHYMLDSPSIEIRHPATVGSPYTNKEVCTFVFAPVNNIYSTQTKTLVTVSVDSLDRCGNCDALYIYKFTPSGGWT